MNLLKNVLFVKYVLDPAERAAATFVEQFVWILVGTTGVSLVVTQNYAYALDAAGFAAIGSVITSVLTFWVSVQQPAVDLLLRVLKTFAQSVFGTLMAGQVHTVTGSDWKGAVAIAFPVAMTALLKGLALLTNPLTHGASLVPTAAAVSAATYQFTDADFDYTMDPDPTDSTEVGDHAAPETV
jgi:hypothetical protein